MKKLPRDLSSDDLCKALSTLGYEVTRQTGSHRRLTTLEGGQHHITIPRLTALYASEQSRPSSRKQPLIWG